MEMSNQSVLQNEAVTSPEEIQPTYEDLSEDGSIPESPQDVSPVQSILDVIPGGIVTEIRNLPEAGGICFTELYTPGGLKIHLTCRNFTGKDALDEIIHTIEYGIKKYKLTTKLSPPPATSTQVVASNGNAPVNHPPQAQPAGSAPVPASAPAPASTPAVSQAPASEEIERIILETIQHGVSESGVHYLLCKGGKYRKYGIKAWPEVLPPPYQGFESWAVGVTYAPVAGFEIALFSGKKVQGFTSK